MDFADFSNDLVAKALKIPLDPPQFLLATELFQPAIFPGPPQALAASTSFLLKHTRHAVARADEIRPGGRKLLTVAGVEIGLFRLADGSFRAYQDYCPHAGAPLCDGEIHSELADPGSAGSTQPVLRCPWHGWEFHLATGAHVRLPSCRLEAFPVECQAGVIYICLPGNS